MPDGGPNPEVIEPADSPGARHIAFDALVLRRPFSGVEFAVSELAAALCGLSGDEFRFSVLWPSSLRHPPKPAINGPHEVIALGSRFPSRALRILYEQLFLPRFLRKNAVDLLHAPAYIMPLATSCPTVLSVYDLHALDNPEMCRFLNRWNYRVFLPASIHRATCILAPSDLTRDAIGRRFPSVADRIRVLPLGIPEHFRPAHTEDIAALRAAFPTLPPQYLLCVGNIEPRKNLGVAVETLGHLHKRGYRHLKLVVAGGRTIGDPAFDRAVGELELPESVVRLGYVAEEHLPALYSRATALLYPSEEEGFGLPPLEAMACGCPVLCADSGAVRQSAGEAAMRFPPRDSRGMAEGVSRLIESAKLRESRARSGIEHAAGYRRAALLPGLAEVYRDALRIK